MKTDYYILSWGFDEGPESPILFKAQSILDVCEYLYENRDRFEYIFRELNKHAEDDITSAQAIPDAVYASYVDGDSKCVFYIDRWGEEEVVDCLPRAKLQARKTEE